MNRITDPCPSCGQPAHRIRYQAHPRNPDGEGLFELIAGIVILVALIVGLGAWAWILEAARV